MVRKKARSYVITAGFVLIVIGAALALCSRPIFTLTRAEVQEVPKSQIIMNYSFNIDQSQNKTVPFQMNIGQNLAISASGSGIFNFAIANFTDPSHLAQPDQPDVVYLPLDNITIINTTWNPVARLAQPGSYYLVFLALNASVDSPVLIAANVTKTWTEIDTIGVPYLGSVLDSSFTYIGLGIVLFGGAISLFGFLSRRSFKKHIGSRKTSTGKSQRSKASRSAYINQAGKSFCSQFPIMLQEKKRMKIAVIIVTVLVVILIIVGSIYSTARVNLSSEKSVTGTNNNSNTNVTSNGSTSNNHAEPNTSQPSESTGDKSVKDLAPTNGALPNASSSASPNDQCNPKPAENEPATGNVTPPDGRIFTGGEEPYAYIPTCSQKGRPLPIVPLGPED